MSLPLSLPLDSLGAGDVPFAGGKACALAALLRAGVEVPRGIVVTVHAYRRFLASTGLRERIALELRRKEIADMRWEELWDASLRIRNFFLTTELPGDLRTVLTQGLTAGGLAEAPLAVRSSAPGEDAASASFAGVHESYVNVCGEDSVLHHIKLVWASLWSDGALLYRRELKLDPRRSAMAVVVQEMIAGERSGVCFTMDPADAATGLVEAVHGLNQGLVDGTIEPDRWRLDRRTATVREHRPALRERWVRPATGGTRVSPLPDELRGRPPLSDAEVGRAYELALRAERHFDRPQDVEWTIAGERLACVQSRPITTGVAAGDDRAAYLSLRRSFENLQELRRRIEQELLPAMAAEADEMAAADLPRLETAALRAETFRRRERYAHWTDVYATDFIPFAHGVRLFGQVYNDTLRPADPYEFVDLLAGSEMISVARNRELERIAALVRDGRPPDAHIDRFLAVYGDTSWGAETPAAQRAAVEHLVLEMAGPERRTATDGAVASGAKDRRDVAGRESRFLNSLGDDREYGRQLLDLGRASYRLRDDDNVYLGRIEGQLLAAVRHAREREALTAEEAHSLSVPLHPAVAGTTTQPETKQKAAASAAVRTVPPPLSSAQADEPGHPILKARQLLGQPAGPGVAVGQARVILGPDDLGAFRAGEVLVCDAIEPAMTFVVPLAAAIVERRGGMLIHGAIIAREYGLPCVTGVPEATRLITTGDRVAVDGHLGIVVVG